MPTVVYTIEDYLKGLVAIDVTDAALKSILADANIESETPVEELTKRQKELLKADLYVWCASVPQSSGSVEDANGVWKHKESGASVSETDRRNWLRLANIIYKRYGITTVGTSNIKLQSAGMRIWKPGVL